MDDDPPLAPRPKPLAPKQDDPADPPAPTAMSTVEPTETALK